MYQSNRLKSQYSKLACLGELSYGNTISAGIDTYSWDPFEGKPDPFWLRVWLCVYVVVWLVSSLCVVALLYGVVV